MKYNLPEPVRLALYVVCAIGGLVVTYLAATDRIGAAEVALATGVLSVVAGVAGVSLDQQRRSRE